MTDTSKPLFIRLLITAVEDLHVGAGTGGGDIDALVLRDRCDRPTIRASHLRGLLREAGEESIRLGRATWTELEVLLGRAGGQRGALSLSSPRVSAEVPTLVWGSTARIEGSRVPEPDTLRYVEYVAAGTVFKACLRLADPALMPLLERLLRRVDRIGGSRNRGGGLVKLGWEVENRADAAKARVDARGTRLRLVLRNREPLCLPATGHPGNLIRSHSFIRGQTLRGALIAWAIRAGHPDPLALFERLSVGDALPLPEEVELADAVRPIPLSILTRKPAGGNPERPWWAGGSAEPEAFDRLYLPENEQEEKPKRPGGHEYLCRDGDAGPWLRYAPEMTVRLRNATPKPGSQEPAELFSLEEIAEDTRFQAELRGDDEAACRAFLDAFAPLLAGDWLMIGRGGAPVLVESVAPVPMPAKMTGAEAGDTWVLTLSSDLIARGEQLGFLDNLDPPALCRLAGLPGPADCKIVDDRFVETERVYGFNAASGLQRSPVLALRRGSRWKLKGPGAPALAAALATRDALGERTREGFGRFLVEAGAIEVPPPEGATAAMPDNRGEVLRRRAKALAAQIPAVPGGPSLSQLQWLRERALAARDVEDLNKLMEEVKTAPIRRPQGGKRWQNFPIQPLIEALRTIAAENPDNAARQLEEQRQFISLVVQWRVLKPEEENRR